MLENKADIMTISEFLVNVLYIILAGAIIYVFIKKVPYIRKLLLAFMWICFFLFTWVICPALGESEITSNTFWEFMGVAFIFAVPNTINEYTKRRGRDL